MWNLIKRPPDVVIGPADNPYMLRWHLIPRNRWFNVYLHHILRSDEDRALHDHPWRSVSLVLAGGYHEVSFASDLRRWWGRGSLIFRAATHAHRLEIPPGGTAWTLFITGPKVRDWGFYCLKGWIPWQEFHGGDASNISSGCGEG